MNTGKRLLKNDNPSYAHVIWSLVVKDQLQAQASEAPSRLMRIYEKWKAYDEALAARQRLPAF